MWDLISELMLFFLGATITAIQFRQELSKKGNKAYITFLGVVILLFLVFGVRKTILDYKEKSNTANQITTISNRIENLQAQKTQDSTKLVKDSIANAEFQKKLFDQFGILRDSTTNKPVKYNTEIKKARDVYIGDR
jgi:hypothetical protein